MRRTMTKLEIIERQAGILKELAAMNEKLVTALNLLNADVDEKLIERSAQLRREAEECS